MASFDIQLKYFVQSFIYQNHIYNLTPHICVIELDLWVLELLELADLLLVGYC